MITVIPTVSFSGESMSPYSIEFSGGGEEKSEMTVVFVDRKGNYDARNRFKRDVSVPVSLKIGAFFNFTGYIVEARDKADAQAGFTLTVTMWDSSIILDKTHIGLKGVQGPGFTTVANGEYGGIVYVGKQIDPCKNIPPNYPDPCAPDCGEDNGGTQSFNCAEEKLLKILEVDYSFPELRDAVAGIVKFGAFPNSINPEYRSNYTGTLREVIKNWCQDFGISFYWSGNSIYFYDLKTGRTINDSAIDPLSILSVENTFSITDNYTKANIAYFGAEGEIREYSCSRSSSKRFVLRPITLLDVLEDDEGDPARGKPGYSFLRRNYSPKTGDLQIGKKQLFESVVLTYYSENFRNLYVLFEREDLDTAVKMYDFSQNATRKAIPTLGGLKPRMVCYILPNGTGQNTEIYSTFLKRMTPNEQVDFTKRGGYFMAAKYNKDLHNKFVNFEKRLADEFMGKYWIRGGVDGDSYTFNAPDGNPTYYSNGAEMQFPFIEILPADIQRTSDFIEDLIGEYNPTQVDKSHGRFLIMERGAAWTPNQTADSVKKIIEELEPFSIEILGSEDVNGANVLQEGEVWMKVFPRPKGLDLDIANRTREENNPADAKNVGVSTEVDGVSATYGLVSSNTQSYGLKTPSSFLKIFLPSQAGPYEGSHYPGYVVLANGSEFSSQIIRLIEKAEYALGSVPASTNLDVAIQVNFRDITQTLVDLLKKNGNTCGYDGSKILALLENFNARHNTPTSIEKETKTYEVTGIPETQFTPKDGLQSFNINQGSDGVKTSLSFTNLPKVLKSEEIILNEYKRLTTQLRRAVRYFKQFGTP